MLTGWKPVVENTPGGGWRVVPNQHVRTESLKAAERILERIPSGGVKADDLIKIAGRGGELPVKARQIVTLADAAAGIARCLRNPVCAVAAAAAGVYIYDKYRTKPGQGGLVTDPGQDKGDFPAYLCVDPANNDSDFSAGQPADACGRMASSSGYTRISTDGPYTRQRTTKVLSCFVNAYGNFCELEQSEKAYFSDGSLAGSNSFKFTTPVRAYTAKLCPPVVDFSDPRYSVAGGPSGYDGKCPTGRYGAGSEEDLTQRIVASPPPDADNRFVEAIREVVSAGQDMPASISTSGPATQVGTPSTVTTTGPNGTVATTSTPTYNYNYQGDTISYTTTVNNTTVNNDGSTSSTTTTTEGPKEDPKDPCEANPNRVGCLELGAAPDDKVQKLTKDLSFSPDSVVLPSGCPPDEVVTTSHGELRISYASACDTAVAMSPLVRALGAFAALLMVAAALRSA